MSSAFDKLARPVQKWIRSKGWTELRQIQTDSIHEVMDGQSDLIVSASTAGGKTEAVFLPLISQVLQEPAENGGFDLVYIGPLKALITDQAMRLEGLCEETELQVVPWHGDVSQSIKSRALKNSGGILLITPESLEALFVLRGRAMPKLFAATRAIVIDELHGFLDNERGVQMRSLLTRLETAVKRPIRRIGLSATLGDMNLARTYLRPDAAEAVRLLEAKHGRAELKLRLRGYVQGNKNDDVPSAKNAVASHLFEHLRGSDNLVFAGRRASVEFYADRLRELCEHEKVPLEFYPHHSNLSKDHRTYVEERLKEKNLPTTSICTSTLELGIDIGDITCVAQIDAPFSVSSLRQRLGRSGRREGQSQILRQYNVETQLDANSSHATRLRLGLMRSIAMIELLLERWCEPPKQQALHLSTLVHQILSIVAERSGVRAEYLYRILCQEGPFRKVNKEIFIDVLHALGSPETGLLEQSENGLLLLGPKGEKLLEHYSFYVVFQTFEEYRLIADGVELGTLPVSNVSPGSLLIFSGRRWLVQEIHDSDKSIIVTHEKAGTPPNFTGPIGEIHDRVIKRMFEIFEENNRPTYMDATSLDLLEEARQNYRNLGLKKQSIIPLGKGNYLLATRCGTVKTATLALALVGLGFGVKSEGGFLIVENMKAEVPLEQTLHNLAEGMEVNLFANKSRPTFEKYHYYLTPHLLQQDALSSRFDKAALPKLCKSIVST